MAKEEKEFKEVEKAPEPMIPKAVALAWLVKLEAVVNNSPDHPMAKVAEVVDQMKNYLW